MFTSFSKYIEVSRPYHLIKNLIVFAPLFFTFEHELYLYLDALIIFFLFYLMSTVVYIFNDISDRNIDKLHPRKKHRPIASGTVSIVEAKIIMLSIFSLATIISYFFNYQLLIVLLLYAVINILYSLKLKEIVFIDILIISSGFILRLLAGSLVNDIYLSKWIYIMTFLLAGLMAVTKRKDAVDRNDYTSTSISRYYTKTIINYIVIIITLSIIVTYTLFTISSEIIITLDNIYVPFTLVFVLLGVGRYLHLIYNKPISYDPIEIFFNDLFMKVNFVLWVLSFYILAKI